MKGVLIVNLGSPDSPTTKDVKKYLGEFLMDKRVIDMPYWKRFLLVKGIILNVRSKKSAEAYQKIWWKEGAVDGVVTGFGIAAGFFSGGIAWGATGWAAARASAVAAIMIQ